MVDLVALQPADEMPLRIEPGERGRLRHEFLRPVLAHDANPALVERGKVFGIEVLDRGQDRDLRVRQLRADLVEVAPHAIGV